MRSISLVFFAAVACTAAVFAESQPSVGSFDDAIDITALSAIQTKLEEILNLLKCGREVFGDAIAESGLKGEFQQFKLQVDKIIKNELPLCRSAGNIGDKYNCLLVNGRKLGHYFYDFATTVSVENKAIAEQIHTDFQRVCMRKPSFIGAETFVPSFVEGLQCVVDAIGEASKTNGMTDVWSKSQPKFQQHLDAWKQCSKLDGKFRKIICNIKGSVSVYALLFEYIASISQNPNFSKFTKDFSKVAQQKCAGQAVAENEYDMLNLLIPEIAPLNVYQMKIDQILSAFKCAYHIYIKAVSGSEFKIDFNLFAMKVENIIKNSIPKCNAALNIKDKFSCLLTSAKELGQAFHEMMNSISEKNKAIAEKIRHEFKSKCVKKSDFYFDIDDETPSLEMLLAFGEETKSGQSIDSDELPIKPPTKPDEPSTKPPTKPSTKPPTKPEEPHGIWQRMKCTVNSITAAVKDSDFAQVWEDHLKEHRAIEARIKVCKTKNLWQRTICFLSEYKKAKDNVRDFFRQFKKTRRDSYIRMLKYIWKRCV